MTFIDPRQGNGATITLASTHWGAGVCITRIEPDQMERESFDWTNYHTSVWQAPQPADTVEPGGFKITFIDNGDCGQSEDTPSVVIPIHAVPEDIGITYGLDPNWESAPTISGTGYMIDFEAPSAKTGEIMEGSATFKWTGPVTFTPHSET